MPNRNKISALDKSSFEKLFKEFFKPLTAFAFKYVKDIDDAKSIVHDAFMKLWEKRDEIDLNKSVKSYLYTSVNNKSLNFIRDNKKFVREEIIIDQLHNDFDNTNELSAKDIQKRVAKTLEDLSPKVRETFILSRTEGLKYKEIAEKMGVSVKTVETHMSAALKLLRENLKEFLPVILLIIISGYY